MIRFLAPLLCLLPLGAQESRYELPPDQRTGVIRRIFVLCHSHLDIGFTRPPDEVARGYKDNIDTAIRLTRENPDFRWTIESTWMLDQWLKRTDAPALIAELGQMLREGRMSLGAAFANMHSGLMGAEETNRLVYLAQSYRRRFGARAEVAFQNDVPGFTWAWPRVLAGSGVKRLITGLNLFIGGGNSLGPGQDPFYWVGPDGSRVLTYFTYDSYVEGYRWKLSGPFTLADLERSVPRRLAWLEKNGYRYDTYLLMASPGDNINPMGAFRILERMREWNRKHPELPMEMVTPERYFDHLLEKYGDHFPSVPGDSAGHWENVKLRVPEAAGKMRQDASDLPAAETAATIAALLTRTPFPRFDLAEAWNALLTFHEHTADAGGGWPGYFSRWDIDWSNTAHYSAALNGFSDTEQILGGSIVRIAAPDEAPWLANPLAGNSDSATIVVYNGLPWKRGGPVTAERLPVPLRDGTLAVTDRATGERVPYQDVPGTKRHIVFLARDVPAVGYRAYSVRKAGEALRAAAGGFSVEVAVDPSGTITSIVDRKIGVRMIGSDPAKPFGALFTAAMRSGFRPEEVGAGEVKTEDGPVLRRITIARKGTRAPLTEVTLYRGAPYADLRFDVDLSPKDDRDLRYAIALPLAGNGQFFLDGAGFVIRVPQDFLPGGRPPQFTPVQFVHQQQDGSAGVTLSSREAGLLRPDMLYLLAAEGFTARTRDEGVQRLFRTEPLTTPVQSFHFRIGAQDDNIAGWKRFGAEANMPLRAVVVAGKPARAARGFFEVSDPGVQLLAFKPAESRPGWYMLRFQENGGKQVTGVKLTTPFRIGEAVRASTTEEPSGERIDLANFSLGAWQTLTVLVRIDPAR